jgi:hypothetical protein
MNFWETYKKGFDAWEKATATWTESWLRSPVVLEPAGSALSMVMRAKSLGDKAASMWWGSLGLPTRRDQERALHALNELESKLLDLEEQLEALKR